MPRSHSPGLRSQSSNSSYGASTRSQSTLMSSSTAADIENIRELELDLSLKQQRINELEDLCDSLSQQNQKFKQDHQETTKRVQLLEKELKNQLEQQSSKSGDAEKRASELEKQLQQQTAKSSDAEKRAAELQKQLQQQSSKSGDAEKRASELEKQLQQQSVLCCSEGEKFSDVMKNSDFGYFSSRSVQELYAELLRERNRTNSVVFELRGFMQEKVAALENTGELLGQVLNIGNGL